LSSAPPSSTEMVFSDVGKFAGGVGLCKAPTALAFSGVVVKKKILSVKRDYPCKLKEMITKYKDD
ncbi:MAG: hypothetical protein KAJ98_08905, partial [Spirochaetaceae bacterium]|nr:hypothetical protein [Spirochaetaceae bacterium]